MDAHLISVLLICMAQQERMVLRFSFVYYGISSVSDNFLLCFYVPIKSVSYSTQRMDSRLFTSLSTAAVATASQAVCNYQKPIQHSALYHIFR